MDAWGVVLWQIVNSQKVWLWWGVCVFPYLSSARKCRFSFLSFPFLFLSLNPFILHFLWLIFSLSISVTLSDILHLSVTHTHLFSPSFHPDYGPARQKHTLFTRQLERLMWESLLGEEADEEICGDGSNLYWEEGMSFMPRAYSRASRPVIQPVCIFPVSRGSATETAKSLTKSMSYRIDSLTMRQQISDPRFE